MPFIADAFASLFELEQYYHSTFQISDELIKKFLLTFPLNYFITIKFQIASTSKSNRITNMPPYVNETQHRDDESFYENMVDELYNPINYEFCSGDVTKGDYVDKLIEHSHITLITIHTVLRFYIVPKVFLQNHNIPLCMFPYRTWYVIARMLCISMRHMRMLHHSIATNNQVNFVLLQLKDLICCCYTTTTIRTWILNRIIPKK